MALLYNKERAGMMHLEAEVFRKFDKQWALVTAGTPEHYNTIPGFTAHSGVFCRS